MSATDYLGKPVKAGDRIVYPVRRGSKLWLNKMDVTKVDESGSQPVLHGKSNTGRPVEIKNITNVIVVPKEFPAPPSNSPVG